MNGARRLFGLTLGRRLPVVEGELTVEGTDGPVTIGRDRWSVPHIEATTTHDVWFGLGFCQGQDRAFQLETLVRAVRGTVAELIGPDGLAIDRLSRRIGFRRCAEQTMGVLDADMAASAAGFAAGVNAGRAQGLTRKPHELTLLRGDLTPWEAADAVGMAKFMAFLLGSNWDAELARLKILELDGPEALLALDAAYADWLPVTAPPGVAAGPAVDALADDLARFLEMTAGGGGSNNWAVAPSRTVTGRPIVANDPHLSPVMPPHFYLAHVRGPEFEAAGATLAGSFGIFAGHNASAGWGVTVGFVDDTDLVVEEVGPDGASVRRPDGFVPCEVRREEIQVRGADTVVEEVLITPAGPIVGPAFEGGFGAIAMRATWLDVRPMHGLLDLVKLRTAHDFHTRLGDWPSANQNVVFATIDGNIGWQLVGEPPRRRSGHGVVPTAGADPDAGWDGIVPFAEMPRALDPDTGWIATANAKPVADGDGPFISADFSDGYRVARIGEILGSRHDWDAPDMAGVQLDVTSIPWREVRDRVLAVSVADPDAATARRALAEWDGDIGTGSTGAAAFELFFAELTRRVVAAKAPNSVEWALGKGFLPLAPHNLFVFTRVSQVSALVREQPADWFDRPWEAEIADVLAAVGRRLAERDGEAPPVWGTLRPLRFVHPASRPPLDKVFDLGPLPGFGDANTVAAAAVPPDDPTGNPLYVPALRMTLDVGAWDRCRWALAGGQSGNPCSPHYDDQLSGWQAARGIPIAWTPEEVAAAVRSTLTLRPR